MPKKIFNEKFFLAFSRNYQMTKKFSILYKITQKFLFECNATYVNFEMFSKNVTILCISILFFLLARSQLLFDRKFYPKVPET